MVIVWHYITSQGVAAIGRPVAYFVKVTGLFWTGVDLFFVLSGFLIGGILLDNFSRKGFYRIFYIRRAARILPVYAVLLGSFFALRAILDQGQYSWLFHDSGVIPDLAYLTFTQNIFMGIQNTFGGNFLGVTWSLSVEEQFYLLTPLLLFLAAKPHFIKIVLLLAVTAPFLRLMFPGFHTVVNTPFRMDSLLVGVLLAAVLQLGGIEAVRITSRYRAMLWVVFVVLLLGMKIVTPQEVGKSFLEPTVVALFYSACIALVLVYRGSRVTALLRTDT